MALHTGAHDGDLGAALSTLTSPPPIRLVAFLRAATALSASPRGTVKLISFLPSRPVVCRIISTLMFFWASRLKILNDIPGTSHILDSQNGNIGVLCNTLDEHTFHFAFLLNNGAGHRIDAGNNLQLDIVLFGQLHAAVVQHLRTQRSQLQHFIKGDFLQLGGLGDLARVAV